MFFPWRFNMRLVFVIWMLALAILFSKSSWQKMWVGRAWSIDRTTLHTAFWAPIFLEESNATPKCWGWWLSLLPPMKSCVFGFETIVMSPKLQVTVKVMLYIMSLVSVDQKEQQMEVHGFYRTQWLDQRLAFSKRFEAGKKTDTAQKRKDKFSLPKYKIPNPFSDIRPFCSLTLFFLSFLNCLLVIVAYMIQLEVRKFLRCFALNKCRCSAHAVDGDL